MSKQSHISNLFNHSGCLSLEALELYMGKGLSEADRKAADEHLSGCIMCSEALEGLAMMAEKPGSAFYTNKINTRLRKSHAYTPLGTRERNSGARFSRLLVPAAASIILLMSIIAYFQFFYPTQQELAILESPELTRQSQEALEMPDQQKTSGTTEEKKETPSVIPETRQKVKVKELATKGSSMESNQEPTTKAETTVGGIADRSEQEGEKSPPPENIDPVIIATEDINSEMEITGGAEENLVVMDLDEEVKEIQAPSSRKKNRGITQDDDMLGTALKSTNSESQKSLRAQKEEADTNLIIFTVVENMPEFPGGQDSLAKYIQNNILLANDSGIHAAGKAYVSFIVNTDGTVSDITLLRGLWDAFDQEAIRLVKEMPAWIPATQRGQPVCVQMVLPIQYIPE